jgi:hypothetical protein
MLQGKGCVSNTEMETIVRQLYDEFDTNRKVFDAQLADSEDIKALEDMEKSIIENNKK